MSWPIHHSTTATGVVICLQERQTLEVWPPLLPGTPTLLGSAFHFITCATGLAGFVLANGSMSSNQSGEGEIRRTLSKPTLWTAWSCCPSAFLFQQIPSALVHRRDKKNGRFRDHRARRSSLSPQARHDDRPRASATWKMRTFGKSLILPTVGARPKTAS